MYEYYPLSQEYKEIINELNEIKLCIVGRDPYREGAIGIPFCKSSWDEQSDRRIAGYYLLQSLGVTFNSTSFLPKDVFHQLAKQGIVVLNASYFYLKGETVSKKKHFDTVQKSFEINAPILQKASKVLLAGDSCAMLKWVNDDICSDNRFIKVPHPCLQGRWRNPREWEKYWNPNALKDTGL